MLLNGSTEHESSSTEHSSTERSSTEHEHSTVPEHSAELECNSTEPKHSTEPEHSTVPEYSMQHWDHTLTDGLYGNRVVGALTSGSWEAVEAGWALFSSLAFDEDNRGISWRPLEPCTACRDTQRL